jgi:hypothetical protein
MSSSASGDGRTSRDDGRAIIRSKAGEAQILLPNWCPSSARADSLGEALLSACHPAAEGRLKSGLDSSAFASPATDDISCGTLAATAAS